MASKDNINYHYIVVKNVSPNLDQNDQTSQSTDINFSNAVALPRPLNRRFPDIKALL